MKVWLRLTLWAAFVGLQFYIAYTFPVGYCGVGRVDPGGPIWMFYVSEQDIWVHALLMLSVMVLMPAGLRIGQEAEKAIWQRMEIIAACVLGLSLMVTPVDPRVLFASEPLLRRVVPVGFLCAVPWLLVRSRAAAAVVLDSMRAGVKGHSDLCRRSSQVFPAIGAAWLVAHRANWTPWNFDPLIVLLTAAHFHHAGFTLPLMAGLNAKARPNWLTQSSCIAVLAGVPLVAAGITCAHFGLMPFVEPLGAAVLVLGALGVAVSQLRRGLVKGCGVLVRAGFIVSGASLLVAMILAMGFGLRHVFPNLALTMPQMWAVHGTLNAFGFGLCGLLAWRGCGAFRAGNRDFRVDPVPPGIPR